MWSSARSLQPVVSLRSYKLLIVSTDVQARTWLSLQLKDVGATVSTAASERDALEALPHFNPDAIICDLQPHQTRSNAFVRVVRAYKTDRGSRVSIIAVNNSDNDKRCEQAIAAGFLVCLKRPTIDRLVAAIVQAAPSRQTR